MKILQNDRQVDFIDFGIVEVGLSKTVQLTVVNDTDAKLIDLKFKCESVEVLEAPTTMEPNSSGIIKLKWTPEINLRKGLKAKLEVEGKEVYG